MKVHENMSQPPPKRLKSNDNTIMISDDSDDDEMPPLEPINKNKMNAQQNDNPPAKNVTIASQFADTIPQLKESLSILSWNIDGLDDREIQLRVFLGIAEQIRIHSPDVVLLQEVVDANLNALQKQCQKYEFVIHKVCSYFNIIMVKKEKNIVLGGKEEVVFPNSTMGRFLLIQELKINEILFQLMTTHLESCAEASGERKKQLSLCFDKMKEYSSISNVILSGDLNLREKEIQALKGPPNGMFDAWIIMGSNSETKFTWDLQLNDNKSFGSVKPRARYDRMYFSSLETNGIKCLSFELVGKDRIEACGLYPSDHFGLLVKFSLK